MTEVITINTKGLVPNHLNDSNVFCRYASNSIIEVDPKEVHFAGYKLNERNFQEIKFTNISDEISRFHIIPPVSKYFRLKYNKPERMVPGFYVKCTVIFTPDKARNYNDFIKIHTKDNENNIIVPIYAYPAIKGLSIPRNILFPVTPLGQKCRKKLLLNSDSDINFDYEIVVVKDHPSIEIGPLTGVIPARSEIAINLYYQPTDYATCEKTINIYVSQYNFQPIVCTLTGTSEPGLERKLLTNQSEKKLEENSDLISISKLEHRRKIIKTTPMSEINLDINESKAQTPDNRKHIKRKLKMDFEQRVRENVLNEKQNQIRWQTCLGVQPISEQEVEGILKNREISLKEHNLRLRQQSDLFELYKDFNVNNTNWKRTIRFGNDDKEFDDSIDTPQFVPECWIVRKSNLERFRSAAWKVIINNRLKIRLKKLIESGGNCQEIDNSHLQPGGEKLTFYRSLNGISEEKLPKTQLTTDNQFDMSEYQILLPIQPKYNYLSLVVPLQMQVLNYERIDISSLSYQPLKSDFSIQSAINTAVGAIEDRDPSVMPVSFSRKPDNYSFDDKDNTLVAFPHNCSYFDNPSYFPLYYYKNELLENNDKIEMDWKVSKSSFLLCKKSMKSNKGQTIERAFESCLIPEEIPSMMTPDDLKNLDYINSSDCPTINLEMMYEEFPNLKSLKAVIKEKWNK